MPKATQRTHIVIPKELVDFVDELVGTRQRSKFFVQAVEEKIARVKLLQAASKVVGSLANTDVPGWETSESAAEWVRALRREDEARLSRSQER